MVLRLKFLNFTFMKTVMFRTFTLKSYENSFMFKDITVNLHLICVKMALRLNFITFYAFENTLV